MMRVGSLGPEAPLEKKMATRFSILAWRIPGTEEPGGTRLKRLNMHSMQYLMCMCLWGGVLTQPCLTRGWGWGEEQVSQLLLFQVLGNLGKLWSFIEGLRSNQVAIRN